MCTSLILCNNGKFEEIENLRVLKTKFKEIVYKKDEDYDGSLENDPNDDCCLCPVDIPKTVRKNMKDAHVHYNAFHGAYYVNLEITFNPNQLHLGWLEYENMDFHLSEEYKIILDDNQPFGCILYSKDQGKWTANPMQAGRVATRFFITQLYQGELLKLAEVEMDEVSSLSNSLPDSE